MLQGSAMMKSFCGEFTVVVTCKRTDEVVVVEHKEIVDAFNSAYG